MPRFFGVQRPKGAILTAELCMTHHRTMNGPGFLPTRHSKVSGYTSSTRTATKICMILMACAAVILTDSENFNMDFLREEAATEAPATAVRRALVGGYEVFARVSFGNELPLLTTMRRGSKPRREPVSYLGQGVLARRTNPLTSNEIGFQFFMHN